CPYMKVVGVAREVAESERRGDGRKAITGVLTHCANRTTMQLAATGLRARIIGALMHAFDDRQPVLLLRAPRPVIEHVAQRLADPASQLLGQLLQRPPELQRSARALEVVPGEVLDHVDLAAALELAGGRLLFGDDHVALLHAADADARALERCGG